MSSSTGFPSDVPSTTMQLENAIQADATQANATTGSCVTVPSPPSYLQGWRLYMLTFGLCLSLLLSTLETTIVSTSLVSITNALQGFNERDWIVTSYLITYTGFLVIYAKFSDIFGAKFMMLLGVGVFTLFSIICGVATDATELIVLRAFQGLGGSGIYSMVMVIAPTMVPSEEIGKYMAIISSVFALSSVLGPILGGAISDDSTWRWVFLLNVPAGAVAIVLLYLFLPSSNSLVAVSLGARLHRRFSKTSIRRLDFTGAFCMLAGSVLLVFALEEAQTRYPWNSPAVISTLVLAACFWAAFVAWELFLESRRGVQEPIFPMRLLKDRILVGMMLNGFFTGFPFTSLVVNIPQRFQAVNAASPTRAGIFLLPLLLVTPFASGISGLLVTKAKVPPFYILLLAAILQLLGVALSITVPNDIHSVHRSQYGFEVLMGLGFGFGLSTLLVLAPMVVSKEDLTVTMGALTQVRVLGGTIGLAICSTVLNSHVSSVLKATLTPQQIRDISDSLSAIQNLPEEQQEIVRNAFADGYRDQLKVVSIFSGLVLLSTLLIWEKKPRAQ